MDRLEDLVLFAEVVERAGFSTAARALGLQRSKLSRRIAELEERLGVRLLQRNTRRVSLTDAGEAVYGHARALAHEARAACDVASKFNSEPGGTLRLACSPTFGSNALMPVVAAFCRAYPNVQVDINAGDAPTDLVGERSDLAFRVTSTAFSDSSLVMRLIGALPMVVAVRPDLVPVRGKLQHPSEVSELGLITLASPDGLKTIDFVQSGGRRYQLRHAPRLMSGNMSILQSAVTAGLGAAVLPRYLCAAAISNGQLVDALDPRSGWQPNPSQVYALLPTRHGVSLTTRLFLSYATPLLEKILRAESETP